MDNLSVSRLWVLRAAFVALSMAIMFVHLIPMDTLPRRWAPPDLLIAFAFAWSLRRPEYVPAVSIAAVMLMADLLFMRPPGLMALLVLIGSEYLKNRTAGLSEASFLGEWAAVSLVLIAVTLLNRLVLSVMVVEQAALSLSLIQMVLTIVAYPVVAWVTQGVMGIRKPAPGDAEAFGSRA